MKRLWLIAALCGVLMMNGCKSRSKAADDPKAGMSNIIIDDAYVLFDDAKLMKMYADINEELLLRYDIDFRVITVASEEDIDLYANTAFARLQKESRSKSGKALLLVINTLQDKVRMEVSTALEPVYTDAFVSYVERKGMVPYLRDYKISDGVYMMTELVHDRANEATQGKEWMPPMESKSIGGGAKSKAHIGTADPNAKNGDNVASDMTDNPKQVLQKYINALKTHNKNPDLDIYTDTTKAFFARWTVTDINQNNELNNISKCLNLHETLYDAGETHAVLAVHPYDKHRTCSPYFFKKEQNRWKLDIATMAQILRFNVDMMWHFDMKKRLQDEGMYYAYAFDGYWFDKNGYPEYVSKKEAKPDNARWGYKCNGWYEPGEREHVRIQPEKYLRCWIDLVWPGSPAQVRLGLDVYDYITAVGEGEKRIGHVTHKQFMDYMHNIPSGSVAVVEVSNQGKKFIRKGVAP